MRHNFGCSRPAAQAFQEANRHPGPSYIPLVLGRGVLVGGSTHLKNISQIGSFPQVGVKIKNVLKPPPRVQTSQGTTGCLFYTSASLTSGITGVIPDLAKKRSTVANTGNVPMINASTAQTSSETSTQLTYQYNQTRPKINLHWWLNQPIWKNICQIGNLPQVSG